MRWRSTRLCGRDPAQRDIGKRLKRQGRHPSASPVGEVKMKSSSVLPIRKHDEVVCNGFVATEASFGNAAAVSGFANRARSARLQPFYWHSHDSVERPGILRLISTEG